MNKAGKNNNDEMDADRFKKFSPQEKLDLSMRLYFSARELKRGAIKHFHPSWDEDRVEEEVRKVFLRART